MVTPGRPVELVVLALGQLARKARASWGVDTLRDKAFSFVEHVVWPRGQEPPRPPVVYAKPDRAPPPRVNHIAVAAASAAVIASLAAGPGRVVARPHMDPVAELLAMVPAPQVRPSSPKRAEPPARPVGLDEFLPFVE